MYSTQAKFSPTSYPHPHPPSHPHPQPRPASAEDANCTSTAAGNGSARVTSTNTNTADVSGMAALLMGIAEQAAQQQAPPGLTAAASV